MRVCVHACVCVCVCVLSCNHVFVCSLVCSEEESVRHRGVSLSVEEDARFFLLRHWTLYDAMCHARSPALSAQSE